MVNYARRPFSLHVEPSQPVRQVRAIIYADRDVAVPLQRASNIARLVPMGALDEPSEQAGDRIVT